MGGKRKVHSKKPKNFKSKESYRKFLAYTHMRTPSGKRAKTPSQSISGRTPRSHKEKIVHVGGKRRKPKLSRKGR